MYLGVFSRLTPVNTSVKTAAYIYHWDFPFINEKNKAIIGPPTATNPSD